MRRAQTPRFGPSARRLRCRNSGGDGDDDSDGCTNLAVFVFANFRLFRIFGGRRAYFRFVVFVVARYFCRLFAVLYERHFCLLIS